MHRWKTAILGDICSINTHNYSKGDNYSFVNYLDTGNITENIISNIQYIDLSNDTLPSRAKRKVDIGDIIYSTVRPNQRHFGIVKELLPNMLVSTGFVVIKADNNYIDNYFLYYFLTQNYITESLHSLAEQNVSAYPSIKPSDIQNITLTLPPIHIQRKISSILRNLDEKIYQNNKINDNLAA